MVTLRVDRILANRGYCPRAHARGFLRRHEVVSGGSRVEKPDFKLDPQSITIDGKAIDPAAICIMLNKPVGYTCSHRDDAGGKLVYELLPQRWLGRNPPVNTVGRLDKETSGLLLLTDDGPLVHRLTSPKRHIPRVYLAELRDPLKGEEADRFRSGTLVLSDDPKPLLPADLEIIGDRRARITVYEGRYHQVRRMFAAVGNCVLGLHRERFGALSLGDLELGQFAPVDASGLTPTVVIRSKSDNLIL